MLSWNNAIYFSKYAIFFYSVRWEAGLLNTLKIHLCLNDVNYTVRQQA